MPLNWLKQESNARFPFAVIAIEVRASFLRILFRSRLARFLERGEMSTEIAFPRIDDGMQSDVHQVVESDVGFRLACIKRPPRGRRFMGRLLVDS